jgi:hypothetical protein
VTRKPVARLLWLARTVALVSTSAGCRIYDAELLDGRQLAWVDASTASAAIGVEMSAPAPALPGCGNGRVDDIEHCDIAIRQGEPGACPQQCANPVGCIQSRLAGQRCGARCQDVEITDLVAGDGCCPAMATPRSDSDCSATCGNGKIEAGETCDPITACPPPETCTSSDACMIARYSGSPSQCNVRCEIRPVTICKSGDGCCPLGCTPSTDRDCDGGASTPETPARDAGSVVSPASSSHCDGGTCPSSWSSSSSSNENDPAGDPTACTEVRSAGPCQVCDCAYCADLTLGCVAGANTTESESCAELLACATENHCSGVDCYCGAASITTCSALPAGPCQKIISDLAGGSRQILQLWLAASTNDTVIGRAASMLACRKSYCSGVCGL